MAPNKMMGVVDKSSDVSLEADDVKLEVEDAKETTPLPVKSDNSDDPNVDVDESDREFHRNPARHLPIDRGWAWVVLGAAVFYLALIGGIRKNAGLFFIAFQERFNSSAAVTTSLTMTQNLVTSVSALIVMTVGMQYINNRTSVMIGSCIVTVSYLIDAFATDINLLYFSFGVMEGFGVAMMHAPVTAAVSEYFETKRGFANGIAYSGASFGGLIFAPIITALFNVYGYSGTMLIVGGMTLNMMITGTLLRPMSFFDRKRKKSSSERNKRECDDATSLHLIDSDRNSLKIREIKSNGVDQNDIKQCGDMVKVGETDAMHSVDQTLHIRKLKDRLSPPALYRSESHDPGKSISGAASPLLLRHRAGSVGARKRTTSETSKLSIHPFNQIVESLSRSKVALYSSTDVVYGSVVDVKEICNSNRPTNNADPKSPDKDGELTSDSVCVKVKKSIIQSFRVLFDKSLLKNPVFQLYMFMAFMVAPSNVFLCVCLAPHAKDLGVSSNDIGLLLSVLSGCGTASRVITALCADRKFVKLTTLLAAVSLFVGLFANCVRFFQTYGALIAFAAVLGASCEIYQAIYAVILVEYLTLAKLKSCIGFAVFIHGASFGITFQLVGVMRDATGSYYLPYHVLGVMEIIGAMLALSLPFAYKRYHRNSEDTVKSLA